MSVVYKVYGTDGCPNCVLAKNLLTKNSINFKYMDANEDFESFIDYLTLHAPKGVRGFPQIFMESDTGVIHVGGFKELYEELN